MNKVVFITGASSGIGKSTAEKFAKMGHIVYGMARREFSLEGVHCLQGDVTCVQDIQKAYDTILAQQGRVDVVVNNAGMGISGPIEYAKEEAIRKQFEVNFFGVVNVNKIFLPAIKKSKGHIISVSSVMAFIPLHFQAFYSATKAALDNYAIALRSEVKKFGVKVCNVQPGDIQTGFTDAREKNLSGNKEYEKEEQLSTKKMEKSERNGMPPSRIANKIYKLSLKNNPPLTCTVGFVYKLIKLLVKILPQRFVQFLADKLF